MERISLGRGTKLNSYELMRNENWNRRIKHGVGGKPGARQKIWKKIAKTKGYLRVHMETNHSKGLLEGDLNEITKYTGN